MSDETIDETETIEADGATDDAAPADEAAADVSDGTEAEADAAPVGAGLTNEWTGGEAMAGRPEVEALAAEGDGEPTDEVIDEDELLADDDDDEMYLSPFDRPGRWFVLHTQSGYEKKVKQNLEARIASMNMENRIHEVVIPTREVPEFKNGKKVMTEKKLFPGYLLCRTNLDDDAWYVIRNTPGVTGFVNQGGKPSPMRRKDVENFLGVEADRKQEQTKKSKPMFEYDMGETVRVKEGPFADFSGEIIEINEDQLKVKVLVNIFGRETPVELEFAQVARL
jgi:transcriptional antiterminator NusG